MNTHIMILEIGIVLLALGLLLIDLWTPAAVKSKLGYVAALGLVGLLIFSLCKEIAPSGTTAFGGMYLYDGLALFFKRFFLVAAILVLLMSVEFADRIHTGIAEFYSILLFSLAGMMFAASANDFAMVFVSLELITVSFYVLVSFQRSRVSSLEAGVKYLILGALSTAFLVFGIALVFGTSGTTNFDELASKLPSLASNKVLLLGLLLVFIALGFKLAAFPMQIWAPDVYQGSPTPVTAFLAVGSKAAGVVLLLRVLFSAAPAITLHWEKLLLIVAAVTILYGNLCAIPQRNLKRLLGYSSISNAGYVLLGIAALNTAGSAAILYFLAGYLFTLIAAFTVIVLVTRETDDITALAGLNQRSPLLAISLTLAMVSLAGVPPLAGFFGKFLLLKAIVEQGAVNPGYYCVTGVAIVGVVISLYYYFGVIRAIYWSKDVTDLTPIPVSLPARASLFVCLAAMLWLGIYPGAIVEQTLQVAQNLHAKIPATAMVKQPSGLTQ